MTKNFIRPVILCGGSGTRLWPLSRAGFPKQFLCLAGDESLFQQAAKRLNKLGSADATLLSPFVVSNEEHRFLAQEQLREIGIKNASFLLEPVGRNTAPALMLAALAAVEQGQDLLKRYRQYRLPEPLPPEQGRSRNGRRRLLSGLEQHSHNTEPPSVDLDRLILAKRNGPDYNGRRGIQPIFQRPFRAAE